GLKNRPYAVIDDGWQASDSWREVNERWGMPMDKVASRIEAMDAKPGLWYRPLKHFSADPTLAEVKRTIVGDIATFREWGYKLLKIDFITFDWNHSWNPLGVSPVVKTDIHWADRTRTTAETIRDLYSAMRQAAGDEIVIIGCNALDHFAAGLFEIQRTGDDTSGCDWALTAKCGPNALGMRAHHHGTFYAQDGDCAGLAYAGGVDWKLNAMWIDLLSRSSGAFFVSWFRDILDDNVKKALTSAFERASKVQSVAEPLDWMERPDPCVWNCGGERIVYNWNPKADVEPKVTKFLVLGDVHYCNYDDNGDPTPDRMNRLAADLAKKNAQFDFVMQVGDIVNCQTGRVARSIAECREEWRYALSEMKRLFPDKPVLITPGNHD
ncbi:MAG: metallophosphoesterase, partial [Kiritimatiellae bacterium]|nr:metallophosphoesterase [Kiritimatiellia bacterium]